MIVTVTPNPSIDRTVTLPTALVRGAVHRVSSVSSEPGGKGVNVARALKLAGLDVVAVLPAAEHDPILAALRAIDVDVHAVPVTGAVRTNLAITESDGTTTKINEPGAVIEPDDIDALGHTDQQRGAGHWLVQSTTPERVAEEAARLRAAPVLVLRCDASFGAVDNFEEEGLANQ